VRYVRVERQILTVDVKKRVWSESTASEIPRGVKYPRACVPAHLRSLRILRIPHARLEQLGRVLAPVLATTQALVLFSSERQHVRKGLEKSSAGGRGARGDREEAVSLGCHGEGRIRRHDNLVIIPSGLVFAKEIHR
jgi:hypothetical protein